MTWLECRRWKAEVGEELGAASVAGAGSKHRCGGRGGRAEVAARARGGGLLRVGRGRRGAARAPGGGGFLWEGPGAAVPASEEGCPDSRLSRVGAPRAVRRDCSKKGAESARDAVVDGGGQQVLPEVEGSLGAAGGEE